MRALALLPFLLLCGPALAGDVEIRAAWIRQPPPGVNAAGYMTIHNTGESARRVVGVRSASAERVELHRTVVEDGVARMTPVQALEIPPGGHVELAPRGLHLMLIRPRLANVESVELVLELDGGETVSARASVRRGTGGGGHSEHH